MASPEKLAIWTNRLTKEFEGLPDKLPPSVTQLSHSMDANEGFCRATFRIALENDDPDLCGPDGTPGTHTVLPLPLPMLPQSRC